jgi:hypothetical protein
MNPFFVLYLETTLFASYFVHCYFKAPSRNLSRNYLLRGRIVAVAPALSATKQIFCGVSPMAAG